MADDLDVQTAVVHGQVPSEAIADAEQKLREVAGLAPRPVRFARLALARETNPSISRRAVVKATLDVDGQPVRAHVAAEEFLEAADRMKDRLQRGLNALADKRRQRWRDTGDSGPGEWRHGDVPSDRPEYFPRPREDREIVRRKTYALNDLTPDEAALELSLLDLDWLLFTELDSGADAVIERGRDGGHRLHLAGDAQVATDSQAIDVQTDTNVPSMHVEEALEALDVGDLPFVFFTDSDTGRGAVVYRRYDGHYGLIVPATAPETGADEPVGG